MINSEQKINNIISDLDKLVHQHSYSNLRLNDELINSLIQNKTNIYELTISQLLDVIQQLLRNPAINKTKKILKTLNLYYSELTDILDFERKETFQLMSLDYTWVIPFKYLIVGMPLDMFKTFNRTKKFCTLEIEEPVDISFSDGWFFENFVANPLMLSCNMTDMALQISFSKLIKVKMTKMKGNWDKLFLIYNTDLAKKNIKIPLIFCEKDVKKLVI